MMGWFFLFLGTTDYYGCRMLIMFFLFVHWFITYMFMVRIMHRYNKWIEDNEIKYLILSLAETI